MYVPFSFSRLSFPNYRWGRFNADPCIFRVFGLSFMVGQMFFQLGLADEWIGKVYDVTDFLDEHPGWSWSRFERNTCSRWPTTAGGAAIIEYAELEASWCIYADGMSRRYGGMDATEEYEVNIR
jgi:hypothetical protein